MPRKYRPEREEYMFFASASSVYGMLRPVEEQEKNNVQVDPKEKAIADEIKNAVEQKYVTDSYKYGWCRSRYGKELTAAGCKQLNEEDFSGSKSCPSAQSSCALKQKMASGSFFQMIRRSNIAD